MSIHSISHLAALLALLLLTSVDTAAGAQEDRYQPIEINADSAVRHEKEGLTSYIGNVRIQQGSLELLADNVTIHSLADGGTEVQASGKPARFTQQPSPEKPVINARAETIHYDVGNGRVELAGDARLQQGEASVSSAHIIYMIDEQVFRAGTDNKDAAEGAPQERVQVIIPAQKKQPAGNDP